MKSTVLEIGLDMGRRRSIAIRVFLSTVSFFLLSSSGWAATYYMGTAGSDANSCATAQTITTPKLTFSSAKGCLSPGDTLIIRDGTYSGASNNFVGFPSGSAAGGYITIKAENDAGVIILSDFTMNSNDTEHHLQFEGLRFEQAGQKNIEGDHVKVKRSGFKGGGSTGNVVNLSVDAADVLLEDVWSYGNGGRYNIIVFNSDRIVLRRVIVRHDGGWTWDGSNPEAGIAFYNTSDTWCLNCIIFDSNLPEAGGPPNSYGQWYAALYNLRNGSATPDHLNDRNGLIGSTLLNNTKHGLLAETTTGTSIGDLTITDSAFVDHTAFGVTFSDHAGPGSITTTVNRATILMKKVSSPNYGVECFNSVTHTVKNLIIANYITGGDSSGCAMTYFDTYNNATTSTGTGRVLYNPETNGLNYIPRIEAGSALKTAGESGGQIGAQIVNKIGVDGTLFGETNWNVDTGNALWPWPLQARIRTEMCATNPARTEWCDGALNLSQYIWNYLGGTCPTGVCIPGGTQIIYAPVRLQ